MRRCAFLRLKGKLSRERLPQAAYELNGVLCDEVLSEVPVLILANKIDLPAAFGEFELVQRLGIYDRNA